MVHPIQRVTATMLEELDQAALDLNINRGAGKSHFGP